LADDLDDALEGGASLDTILALDQRNKELRNCIIRNEKDEESIQQWQIAVHISKRVALVELIDNYIKERDARRVVPKKKWKKLLPQSSPKARFLDLLFLETIKVKGEQREEAKSKFNYWI
jgi:hypothetical protein